MPLPPLPSALSSFWDGPEEKRAKVISQLLAAGYSLTKLASHLHVHHSKLARILHRAKKANKLADSVSSSSAVDQEEHDIAGGSWVISMKNTRICNEKELIAHCKIDAELWEVERFKIAKSEVGMKQAAYTTDELAPDGRVVPMWRRDADKTDPIVVPLYHITAWLKKRIRVADARQKIVDLVEDAKVWMPKAPALIRPAKQSGNMLEVSFHDAHFGKLAWGRETGWDDQDLQSITNVWNEAVETTLDRTRHLKYESVKILLGSDMLHIDNRKGETTAGTQVDTDSRYHRIFRKVRKLFCDTVETFRSVAPVDVIPVPGNHDNDSTLTMAEAVYCWFHNYKDVLVDYQNPTPRKYIEWGHVMMMWTHGNDIKLRKLMDIMPIEEPEMWGRTRFREIHTGDKHHREAETQKLITEELGTVARILPSFCAADSWHSGKGFIGNQRMAESYMWNKWEGLLGTAYYTKQSDKYSLPLVA
jgi:hypothetical protein